jgi:hypothetical protein
MVIEFLIMNEEEIERREKSLKKNRIMYSMKQKYFQILAKVSEIHICLI